MTSPEWNFFCMNLIITQCTIFCSCLNNIPFAGEWLKVFCKKSNIWGKIPGGLFGGGGGGDLTGFSLEKWTIFVYMQMIEYQISQPKLANANSLHVHSWTPPPPSCLWKLRCLPFQMTWFLCTDRGTPPTRPVLDNPATLGGSHPNFLCHLSCSEHGSWKNTGNYDIVACIEWNRWVYIKHKQSKMMNLSQT